jgi:hypothetical protein
LREGSTLARGHRVMAFVDINLLQLHSTLLDGGMKVCVHDTHYCSDARYFCIHPDAIHALQIDDTVAFKSRGDNFCTSNSSNLLRRSSEGYALHLEVVKYI